MKPVLEPTHPATDAVNRAMRDLHESPQQYYHPTYKKSDCLQDSERKSDPFDHANSIWSPPENHQEGVDNESSLDLTFPAIEWKFNEECDGTECAISMSELFKNLEISDCFDDRVKFGRRNSDCGIIPLHKKRKLKQMVRSISVLCFSNLRKVLTKTSNAAA